MWYQSVQTIDLWGIKIQVWGLLLAIGTMLAWFLFDYNLLWRRIKHDSSWVMSGFIISALAGARLMQIILDWGYYSRNPEKILAIWEGGMASYGAYILGFTFLWLYIKKYVKQKTDFLEAAIGPMFLALMVARTGCFIINDHLGKLGDWPWSIAVYGEMRHPLSLYYVLLSFILFTFFSYLFYQKKYRGYLFWLAIAMYSGLRLTIDLFWKDWQGNQASFYGTIITSVVFIAIGVVKIWHISKQEQKI